MFAPSGAWIETEIGTLSEYRKQPAMCGLFVFAHYYADGGRHKPKEGSDINGKIWEQTGNGGKKK